MQEMYSKRPKIFHGSIPPNPLESHALVRVVHSLPTPKILPPTQIPIENPDKVELNSRWWVCEACV